MKFLNLVAVFVFVLTLVACTSVQQSTRISTTLRSQEYNSLASRYMERPTFVEVETLSSGETVLMVEMDTYAVPSTYRGLRLSPGEAEVLRKSQLRFLKEYVNKYVAAIDKFLEWESLASQRKEAFTRDISSVPAWGNIGNGTFKFKFHSGNDRSHFLVIAFSAAGTTLDEKAQYFDVRNAKELKRLLLAFESGSIQHTALDDIYK